MERIIIRGTSGSGKTTLGQRLSERLNMPLFDLDDYYHLPGWQIRPTEEFRAIVAELVAHPKWVMVGNYRAVADLNLPAADTVIWLDFPLRVTFFRVLRRTLRRALWRERCCNGNQEDLFRTFFTRDSILWWTLTTHARRHRQCADFLADTTHPHLVKRVFAHPSELEIWLKGL